MEWWKVKWVREETYFVEENDDCRVGIDQLKNAMALLVHRHLRLGAACLEPNFGVCQVSLQRLCMSCQSELLDGGCASLANCRLSLDAAE